MDRDPVSPTEIQKALQLTHPHWTELTERHEGLEGIVEDLIGSRFLLMTHCHAVNNEDEYVYDLRTAVALRVSGLLHPQELDVFASINASEYVDQAIMLVARALRERVHYFTPQQLIETMRTSVFNAALRALAADMREPAEIVFAVLNQLDLSSEIRRQLLDGVLLTSQNQRNTLVLH